MQASAQTATPRLPLSALPAGLEWSSVQLDRGQVLATLSSAERGSYLVQGDSAVYLSPRVLRAAFRTERGLRIGTGALQSSQCNAVPTDSLYDESRRRLVGFEPQGETYRNIVGRSLDPAGRAYSLVAVCGWAGGNITIPVIEFSDQQTSLHQAITRRGSSRDYGGDYSVVGFGANASAVASATYVPGLNVRLLSGDTSFVYSFNGARLDNHPRQGSSTFTELSRPAVGFGAFGSERFALVSPAEFVLFDTAGRELAYGRWPNGFRPVAASSATGDASVRMLGPGAGGRLEFRDLGEDLRLSAGYRLANSARQIAAFSMSGHDSLAVVGFENGVYFTARYGADLSAEVAYVTSGDTDVTLSGISYPLLDTLAVLGPLTISSFSTSQREGSVPQSVRPLVGGGLVAVYPDYSVQRGLSGQYLGQAGTKRIDSTQIGTAFDSRYRFDDRNLYFTGASGEERLIREFAPSTGASQTLAYLGATPLGTAIMFIKYYDQRGSSHTNYFVFIDSLGTFVTNYQASGWYGLGGRLQEGLLVVGSFVSSHNGTVYTSAQATVIPWWTTALPMGVAEAVANCRTQVDVPVVWPRVPVLLDTFRLGFAYGSDEAGYFGRLGSLFYRQDFTQAFDPRAAFDSLLVRPVCRPDLRGEITIVGLDSTRITGVQIGGVAGSSRSFTEGQGQVVVVLTDTAGCSAAVQAEVFFQEIRLQANDACAADGLGLIYDARISQPAPELSLAIDGVPYTESNYVAYVPPGTYTVTASTADGCRVDTLLTVGIESPMPTTVDTVAIAGRYRVQLTRPDTQGDYVYQYTYADAPRTSFTLAPGTYYTVYTVQINRLTNNYCTAALEFTLGAGIVNLAELPAPDLNVYVDADGNLQLSGIPASAKTLRIYDALGRDVLSEPLYGPTASTSRPAVLPKGVYILALLTDHGGAVTRKINW